MINSFEDFDLELEIIKSLDFLQYKNPFNVQKEVIPRLLKNKNLLVKAKTGSGKSASFGIPICNNIDRMDTNIRALVIVPTRELATQVKEEIENIGRRKLVKCSAILGKESLKEQELELKQGINVIVATPGRMIDHISRNNVDLSSLQYLVIDEVDKMLTKGFKEDIDYILSNIGDDVCKSFFSATVDENLKSEIYNYVDNYEYIEIKEDVLLDDKITQKYIRVYNNKLEELKKILDKFKPSNAIVFANTKNTVDKLYSKLQDDFSVEAIHGDISQQKRFYIVDEFKSSKFNILISSDIIARGIHIDDVDLVVNYDIPADRDSYIHRIGRTARAGRRGIAVSLVSDDDIKDFEKIENYIGQKIEEVKIEDIELFNKVDTKVDDEITSLDVDEIVKIYINLGKKKKIRIGDIVGALNNIDILDNTDIGVIKVYDTYSHVDILNKKGRLVLEKYEEITVKNKKAKIKRVF